MGDKSARSADSPLTRWTLAAGAQCGAPRYFGGNAPGDFRKGVHRPRQRLAAVGRGMRCPNCRPSRRVLFRPGRAGMWVTALESSLRIAALVVANLPAHVLSQIGMMPVW